MTDRALSRWWTTRSDARQVVLLVTAYVTAIASIVSYAYFNAGTGMPTRTQMALMLLPVAIVYYLSLRSNPGR